MYNINMFKKILVILFLLFCSNLCIANECNFNFESEQCDNDHCIYSQNSKYGIYSNKGCYIIEDAKFDSIEKVFLASGSESFIISQNNKYMLVYYLTHISPLQKEIILPLEYDSIQKLTYEEVKVGKNGKYAIYNVDNEKFITKFYDDIKISGSEIWIKKNNKWIRLNPIKNFFSNLSYALMILLVGPAVMLQ